MLTNYYYYYHYYYYYYHYYYYYLFVCTCIIVESPRKASNMNGPIMVSFNSFNTFFFFPQQFKYCAIWKGNTSYGKLSSRILCSEPKMAYTVRKHLRTSRASAGGGKKDKETNKKIYPGNFNLNSANVLIVVQLFFIKKKLRSPNSWLWMTCAKLTIEMECNNNNNNNNNNNT